MKKLVIIDGKSVFYRGYYAMGALSMRDGTPTSGVFGFAVIAMEIVRKIHPDKVVVAWDKAHTSTEKRLAIYPEYKAGRVKPPEDFYAQIPILRELIEVLGWGFSECDGYEADDIIGTYAKQAEQLDASMSDHSTSHHSSLRAPVGQPAVAGALPIVFSRKKIDPEVDEDAKLKVSLNKDSEFPLWDVYIISSDLDMLQVVSENVKMYRVLRGFSNIEEMDVPAVEEKYGIRKDQFLDLKALKGDASDNIPGVPGIGEKTAAKLLAQYGTLDGIYENIDKIAGKTREKLIAGKDSAYMSKKLAKIMTDAPVKIEEIPDFVIDGDRILAELNKLEFRSVIKRFETEILGNMDSEEKEDLEEVPDLPDDVIVGLNIKELMHRDARVKNAIFAGEKYWDLGQGKFLLDPLARVEDEVDVKREYWRQRKEFEEKPELMKVLMEFDLPMIPVLFKMEETGILINKEYFGKLKEEYEAEVGKLMREIYDLAGTEFNVNSPLQLSEVLYEKLGLPTKGIKKGSRGYSTGVKELGKLKDLHPIVPKLMEYREASKLLSTYILPLPELADSDGRVHTTFTQNVTATGRLSSVNPNLQNIPVRTEEGRKIRTGFVAAPGKCLISADYSQFELRLAAVLAGDEKLVADFNAGIDIHTKTASDVFGVPMDEVTKQQRRAAKTINFGVLYGMSAKGLADATGMTVPEAKQFINDYFAVRRPIREYLDKILAQAREKGYVETYFGRRRPTPDVKSSNFIIRAAAERAAQNMPIQGTEADLMKRAMIKIDKALPAGAEMILQVHDSVVVECDCDKVDEISELLQRIMEGVAPELKIKLAVEVTDGGNWGEL